MLEIKVTGDIATGKTTKLMEMAERELENGGRVLYVAPTEEEAANLVNVYFALKDRKPYIASAGNLDKELIARWFDLIVFDGLDRFGPATPEGSHIALARHRLSSLHHGVLAYSTYTQEKEVWVSTSVWYKPWTWRSGYWVMV